LSPKRWKQPPRGVVDTSVLVAGVSGFRDEPSDNPSAALIAAWTEPDHHASTSFKVPAKEQEEELIAIVGNTKKDIVKA
jgi:hypothetical protein